MVKSENSAIRPPSPNEIEISLFGPSYGESVVVHAGHSNWFVIDSCFSRGTSESAPLRYLRKLGVDLENEIRGIVVTHWDQDHIRGLGQILEAAPNAEVIISAAFYCEELLALLEASKQLASDDGHAELRGVFSRLETNLRSPLLAAQDKTLWNDVVNSIDRAALVALAPSDATIMEGHLEVGSFFQQVAENRGRPPQPKRNHRSIVLWLRLHNAIAILGSDLEETGNPNRGWSAIVNSNVTRDRASAFKIPHHGSENGDCAEIWPNLLHPNPIGALTPWRRGGKLLPTREDLTRLLERTDSLYITAIPQNEKVIRASETQAAINAFAPRLYRKLDCSGHIMVRADATAVLPEWTVTLFATARKVTPNLVRAFPKYVSS